MSPQGFDEQAFAATAAGLRPDLHRYCARLTGSVLDAEDVVQDTIARAIVALRERTEAPDMRPWLFRIAHNRALDLLRSRAVRSAERIDAAEGVADPDVEPADDALIRREAVDAAVSRFGALPVTQRSVVILKDVLEDSLQEIASLLDLTVDAVKAHLARGRAALRATAAAPAPARQPPSPGVLRFIGLFNQRDWDGLRALLAEDVRLRQSWHDLRTGAADVGEFFGIYATLEPYHLAPAWLEGREVIAVFAAEGDAEPLYLMRVEWRDGRIAYIHDYRYVRYVMESADLKLG